MSTSTGTTTAQNRVWTVGASGDFSSITAAIAAASEGDTLLVRSGSYAGFALTKGLTIVANSPANVQILASMVQGLSSTQHATLQGLHFMPEQVFLSATKPGLALSNDTGPVWVERCEIGTFDVELGDGAHGLVVDDCRRVVLIESDGAGNRPLSLGGLDNYLPGHGLSVSGGSRVAIYGGKFLGATGHLYDNGCDPFFCVGNGSDGIRSGAGGNELFLSGVHAVGGNGVSDTYGFATECSAGGAGVRCAATGVARLLDSQTQGGPRPAPTCGFDGPAQTRNVLDVPGTSMRLSARSPLREGQTFELAAHGPGGAPVWLLSSSEAFWLFTPEFRGTLLVPPSAEVEFLGYTDASGNLRVSRPAPVLPPGDQSTTTFLQVVYQNLSSSGAPAPGSNRVRERPESYRLGAGTAIVTLDPSF